MELNPLSDDDVKALANDLEQERNVMEMDEAAQAKRIFVQYAPVAATQICRLASNGSSERLRFQAAQYVLDRAIGRVQDALPSGQHDPLQAFMQGISKELTPEEMDAIRMTVHGAIEADGAIEPEDGLDTDGI